MSNTGKIFQSMAAVMRDIEAIGKDQENKQQGFKYRGIDDVYNALHGILAQNGIFTTPEVMEKTREERITPKGGTLAFTCLRMKYTFWADDGSSVFCIVEGEGMDSGDKSSNKAMAVAHKYALLQTFCIPTAEEKDPDAEAHEVAPRTQAPRTTHQTVSPAREAINARILAALKKLFGDDSQAKKDALVEITSFKGKDGNMVPGKPDYRALSDKVAEIAASQLEKLAAEKRAQAPEICADCRETLADGRCVNPNCPSAPF